MVHSIILLPSGLTSDLLEGIYLTFGALRFCWRTGRAGECFGRWGKKERGRQFALVVWIDSLIIYDGSGMGAVYSETRRSGQYC